MRIRDDPVPDSHAVVISIIPLTAQAHDRTPHGQSAEGSKEGKAEQKRAKPRRLGLHAKTRKPRNIEHEKADRNRDTSPAANHPVAEQKSQHGRFKMHDSASF
tara:strand:- start:4959 stop:5267 length:309 start_codon:yes stop_codon:yes gene_type:complete